MDIHDCNRTRVAPLFNWLYAHDPTGRSWVRPLLALPGEPPAPPRRRALSEPGRLRRSIWWPDRVSLKLPRGLDAIFFKLALRAERGELSRRRTLEWMFWDGAPGPSVLLATTRVITIIEARRAASNEVESPRREALRLLRNLDAVYDNARGRFLAGLFIVEEDDGGVETLEALRAACHTVVANPRTLTKWLPHRQPAQRREIAGALLGVTSWQRVCRELAVPWSALPDSVLDVPLESPPADDEPLELEAGEERSVVVGRDLDDALEAHRLRLAHRANTRFPPMTLTDAARRALASFYRSPAWRALREASAGGVFPARRTHAATGRWRFVLQRDAKLQAAIEWQADLLDGTWDDAVDDALFRYYNDPSGRLAIRTPRPKSSAKRSYETLALVPLVARSRRSGLIKMMGRSGKEPARVDPSDPRGYRVSSRTHGSAQS